MTRTRRPAAVAAAATLWLASGLAYAPVASAEPPRIHGTKDAAGAPALPDGDSVDTMGGGDGPEGTLHYRVERPDLSTSVFFGAAMPVPQMGTDGVAITTDVNSSQNCMMGTGSSTGSTGRSVLANGGNAMEACPQQPAVTARLQRYSLDTMTSKDTPTPVLLRVVRVPEVTNLQDLPESLPKNPRRSLGRGAPGTIVPSTTIVAPASVKADLSYSIEIKSNTPQYFAIDVDWGQTVMVQADVALSAELKALGDRDPQLQIDLLGPALNAVGRVDVPLDSGTGSRTLVANPVVWRSYAKGGKSSFLAGRHLIAVGLPEGPFGKPTNLTYTLTVDVEGGVTGVPKFDRASTDVPTARADHPTKRYAALGLGASGALMLIASGVIWLRSRS